MMESRDDDEYWERIRGMLGAEYTRPILLPWLVWALTLAACIGVVVLVSGCSSVVEGTCAVQPIGQDDKGVAYFRYHCEPM